MNSQIRIKRGFISLPLTNRGMMGRVAFRTIKSSSGNPLSGNQIISIKTKRSNPIFFQLNHKIILKLFGDYLLFCLIL